MFQLCQTAIFDAVFFFIVRFFGSKRWAAVLIIFLHATGLEVLYQSFYQVPEKKMENKKHKSETRSAATDVRTRLPMTTLSQMRETMGGDVYLGLILWGPVNLILLAGGVWAIQCD